MVNSVYCPGRNASPSPCSVLNFSGVFLEEFLFISDALAAFTQDLVPETFRRLSMVEGELRRALDSWRYYFRGDGRVLTIATVGLARHFRHLNDDRRRSRRRTLLRRRPWSRRAEFPACIASRSRRSRAVS